MYFIFTGFKPNVLNLVSDVYVLSYTKTQKPHLQYIRPKKAIFEIPFSLEAW